MLEDEDIKLISINNSLLPLCIRESLLEHMEEDDLIYQVDTDLGIEWWLIDNNDNLVECFWIEK